MKLWLIMAQIISLASLLAIICINYLLLRTVDSQLSPEYLSLEITYDELYQSGMQSYTNEEWEDTIFYFERALQEFHYYRKSLTDCRLKCQNLSLISTSKNDSLSEMKLFQAIFKKADCTRRCKVDRLGSRSERIDEGVTDKFLSMTPYSYLQFAYYKNGMYEKAVSAAYTYLQWHPEDEVMQNNLDYYRNMHGIEAEHLVNLEEKPHHKHFLAAYQAHQDSNWNGVITEMEEALKEYWKADAECRALCEGKYDNREFKDLYEAISNHYASTLYCKDQCESWLAMMHGKEVEDYLPSHFHFLQFSYYKDGAVKEAIRNAASHLLFHPDDEVMLANMDIYEEMEDPDIVDFGPRLDAKAYHDRIALEKEMLSFAKRNFWSDDPEEALYPDKDIKEEEAEVDYLGAEPINPQEVHLKETESVNIRGDYGLLEDYKGGEAVESAPVHDPESEKGSAKYSKDLNHQEEANHQHGGPVRERFPVPLEHGNPDTDQRSKILDGIKKIVQTLMGSSEEESERLIRDLSRDPKSREIKERIRKAIEKMMASGDFDNRRSNPREQLKSMIEGLTQKDSVYDHTKQKTSPENYDPGSLLQNEANIIEYPNIDHATDYDLKEYNPMKGLDHPEYFDWVNPPGYEGNAPGSQGIEVEETMNDVRPRFLVEDDDHEELIGEREYYPSDEEGEDLQSDVSDNGDADDSADKDDGGGDGVTGNSKEKHPGENNFKIKSDDLKNEELLEEGIVGDETREDNRVLEEDLKLKISGDNGHTFEDTDKFMSESANDADGYCVSREKCDTASGQDKTNSATINNRYSNNDEDNRKEDNHAFGDPEDDPKRELSQDDESIVDDASRIKYADNIQDEEPPDEEMDEDCGCAEKEEDEEEDCGCSEEDDEEEEEEASMGAEVVSLEDEQAKLDKFLEEEELDEEAQKRVEELKKIEDNAYYLLEDLVDLEVVMTDRELNGSNRVVADGIAADQECGILLQLLDEEAKVGDGYKGKKSPHTKHELFEGLTVKDAVNAAESGRIPLLYPTVYMHLAERSRQFLQRHFKLKSHLFFSFTHLVCREAKPGRSKGMKTAHSNLKRRDLSHPVHADNCNLDPEGVCHKKLPAFVWRDWSAILYLNENFEGGEFLFAHFNETPQAVVYPRCGRLVGFSAGSENLHGVKGVIQGRRCALAMWYTLDPRFREIEFFKAAENLNTLYEHQYMSESHL